MDENKKVERKRKRFAARLKSSKGILCTDVCGPYIILCNVGQATGIDKDIICKLIKDVHLNIEIPKLLAEKGESHSYLIFKNTSDAVLFFNLYNGKAKIDEKNTPLYMSFVNNVPNTEIVCGHKTPKGLILLENFITKEEENQLIKLFDWTESIESSNLKNRQVKHYGYEFRYGSNDVDLNSPLSEKIPEACDILWMRLKNYGYDWSKPDQLTVNKYWPGQGIPSHVDKHSPFGNIILSLSLGSSVVMDWKHHSGMNVPVVVPKRSLLVMQDEARYDWQHGIQPRTWDPIIEKRAIMEGSSEKHIKIITSDTVPRQTRISLTFRWTRSGPCECVYKTLCDSVEKSTCDIKENLASNLEELHVHQVYEQIAGHFSTTRHKPWPKVVQFMQQVPAGSVLLDLGCGNGKNILKRNDIVQIAGERSSGLLSECKQYVSDVSGADCVRLDLLHAGLRDRCADVIICIAVVHHFSSEARRLQAISTILRLLRNEGRALITVWAKDQTKSNYLCKSKLGHNTDQELHTTIGGINLPIHENRTQFQHNDLLVPWKLRRINENKLSNKPESTLLRYYHVFEEGELENLCRQLPDVIVENSFYEEGNWCVVCRKI